LVFITNEVVIRDGFLPIVQFVNGVKKDRKPNFKENWITKISHYNGRCVCNAFCMMDELNLMLMASGKIVILWPNA